MNNANDNLKKRPSIELSPTLERPVYIITKHLNGSHILALTECFDKHKIPYQMQQETHTLGSDLKQRFFVVVDNRQGEVTLGPEFGSILMSIIGYPRIGKNPKNKYFQKPQEIAAFYQKFKTDRDISERQKTLILSQYMDVIMQKDNQSSSKIVCRSISKYKNAEKQEEGSKNSLKDKANGQFQKNKLIIVEEKKDQTYSKLCLDIYQRISLKSQVEIIGMEQVKKKALLQTNKVNLYYLTNQQHQNQLVENITIGEIIVFANKNKVNVFQRIIDQNKIYAICCQRNQIIKVLEKIGFNFRLPSQLPQTSNIQEKGPLSELSKAISSLEEALPQNIPENQKEPLLVEELSRIDALQSVVSQKVQQSELNASAISHTSTNSKRIKRLKPAKSKLQSPPKPQNQYYAISKKENQAPSDWKHETKGVLKKTLKSEEKNQQNTSKSKKSLKFIDEMVTSPRLKKIKSIAKCAPETVQLQTTQIFTMTDSDYFSSSAANKLQLSSKNSYNAFGKSLFRDTSNEAKNSQPQNAIHAVFYRQFIPKFHNIVHLIKLHPSGLFNCKSTFQFYQPFFNTKEFDRSARKIKQKLREKQKDIQQFNFIVLLLEEEAEDFQKYCQIKNAGYSEMQADFESTAKTTNLSILPGLGFKINLYLFLEGDKPVIDQTVDFGKIKLFKIGLGNCLQQLNQTACTKIEQKIMEWKINQNRSFGGC